MYFKIGDSHKCMTIVVTLKNKPLEKYPDLQGTYQLESSRSEPRCKSKWKSNIRHKAIWYNGEQKTWAIGDAKDNFVYISGMKRDTFNMPCDENYWAYYNFDRGQFLGPAGYGKSGEANDINIQCIGNLQQGN